MKQTDLDKLCKLLLAYKTELAEANRQTELKIINGAAVIVACDTLFGYPRNKSKKV